MKQTMFSLRVLTLLLGVTYLSSFEIWADDKDKYWINEDFSNILNESGTVASNNVLINYSGNSVEVTNPFAGQGVEIAVSGQHVVVNSTLTDTEVNYQLSGTTTNGSFKIYGVYKLGLTLNGVNIQNQSGAAINIQVKKKITVILADKTENKLVDSNSYVFVTDEDMKGTIFSEGQLVFEGTGSLSVDGNYKHAICADDYIQINGGTITVNKTISDGIHAKDYFQMEGGNLTITSSSDGVDCEAGYFNIKGGTINATSTGQGGKGIKSFGNMNLSGGNIVLKTTGNAYYDSTSTDISSPAGIKCDANLVISDNCNLSISSSGSAGKGISVDSTMVVNGGIINVITSGAIYKYSSKLDSSAKAIKCDGNITINGGNFTIKTSKDGAEGIESKNILTINGGNFEIEAYDDALNAAKQIVINGGQIYCYSSNNDGIDSNGTLTITGGLIVSSGYNSPEEGFDCDNNTFKITGGIIIGTGGATSNPTSNVCTQRSLVYNVKNLTAGQLIHIESSTGKEALTFKVPRTYSQNLCVLFSAPELTANNSFTIYTGGSVSGGTDFHGYYTGATYVKGTSASTFTTSSMVTTVGTGSGPGPR